jgi:amino acid adenylation domain-containing protein
VSESDGPQRTVTASSASYAQERLWFYEELVPGSALYSIAGAVRLDGPLAVPLLRRALNACVARHEALRTSLRLHDGTLLQVVAPDLRADLPVVDLAGAGPGTADALAGSLAEQEAARPFDLRRAPLIRATLLRCGPRAHVLLVTVHHAVADAWSLGILVGEVIAGYAALTAGRPVELPPLPLQYADFAEWQRGRLDGGVLAAQQDSWRRVLRDLPTLDLPADRVRPAAGSHRGTLLAFDLGPGLSARVTGLARDEGATPFMVLLAGFAGVLSRWTGQHDVVVGTAVAGRDRPETQSVIGMFVNLVALRTDLSGAPTFRELVGRAAAVCRDAYRDQDVPFDRVVELAGVERRPGRHPLFQVALQLVSTPPLELAVPGLAVRAVEPADTTAKFDLLVTVRERDGVLSGEVQYATDLFDPGTVSALVGSWRTLLEGASRRPDVPVDRIALAVASPAVAAGPAGPAESLAGRFEEQVAAAPGQVALVEGDRSWTYAELDRRAGRLAHALRAAGVGAETPVGVHIGRSADAVVAILAVLKTGGTYVPLDPAYPARRLDLIAADARLRAVILADDDAGWRPDDGVAVIRPGDGGGFPDAFPAAPWAPGQLAYVMYTSGSTGGPKGIGVTHEAVARLVVAAGYVDLRPADRIAHAASVAFDASTFEIWAALLTGATLVVLDRETMLDPAALVRVLRSGAVSVLFLTTALLNQVADADPGAFGALRCLLFGGEPADPERVAAVLRAGRPERLLHVYGPTEATTFAAWHRVEAVEPATGTVPIGGPIPGTSLHVLDRGLEPLPPGAAGELFIGGRGLARGYLHRPGLTADRFVPDPGGTGARLYRTGDRVRWRADGSLQFLGRLDRQLKIRGHRIEPAEVEASLRGHPAVKDCVVLPVPGAGGEPALAAYVVLLDHEGTTTDGVREFLAQRLPSYLVPAHLVPVDEIPLTVNGKLDAAALPSPADRRRPETYVGPRTPLERDLADLWCRTLGISPVGVHDDFFRLGGHSLLATTVVTRVREKYRVELPLRRLFETPTVAGLAAAVEAARRERSELAELADLVRELESGESSDD